MADKAKSKTSFFQGVKSEFKKIIWPTKNDVVKETTAVVIVGVLLGVIISVVDTIIKFGIELIVE